MDRKIKEWILENAKSDENGRIPVKKIVDSVRKEFRVDVTYDAVRNLIRRVEEMRRKISEANDSVESKKDYEVIDGKYILKTKHGVFKLTVDEVDEIFKDYASKGNNLTEEEMLKKWRLKPEVWVAIKNKLRLYKASNTVSPHSAENLPDDALEEKIQDAIGSHIDKIKDRLVVTHQKQFKKEALKAFKVLGTIDEFLSHMRSFLDGYKPLDISFPVPETPHGPQDQFTVFLADAHFGKLKTNEIVWRFDSILNECKARTERKVNVCFMGDLAETLSPILMHDSQIGEMESMKVFETMMFIVNVVEKFLIALRATGKTVEFHGIAGNHDRITRNHDQDVERTGALVIYELIKRGLSKVDVEVNYYVEKINSFKAGNLNFVLHHGDDGFSNRKPEDILWKHGEVGSYNVVVHGDKHTVSMRETKNGMMIGCPALAGQGAYDKRLDLASEPGIIIVTENARKTADVLLKRL